MDNSRSLELVELDLESHVEKALRDAQKIAAPDPVGRDDLLIAVIINARGSNSGAFETTAHLCEEPLRHRLNEASGQVQERSRKRTRRRQDAVALDADLSRSYEIAQEFLQGSRIWGRDLVTIALLASKEPFVAIDREYDIGSYQDEWYRFVTSGQWAEHREWAEWWQAAGLRVPEEGQKASAGAHKAYLLTWNAEKFDISNFRDRIDEFGKTGITQFGWSLGRRKSSSIGDRVFLLKQGQEPRGLVGTGKITGDAAEVEHWDAEEAAAGKTYFRVPITWDALSDKPLITKDELNEAFPHESLWTAQGGGQEIDPDLADRLAFELTNRLTASSARPRERVKTHADNPARVDQLGRRPFAEIIAARIDEARQELSGRSGDEEGSFMVLLHGPWGSGKSSVLNFIREKLQEERGGEPEWVVVDFNAWRHQRLSPPWWTVIKQVYSQSREQLTGISSFLLRLKWWIWRVRADWIPVLVSLLLIGIVAFAVFGVSDALNTANATSSTDSAAKTPANDQVGVDAARAKSLEVLIRIVTATIAAIAAIVAFSRSLAFGSESAAKTYLEMRDDPLKPIVRLFKGLIRSIPRPVAVFVDDLDRCDEKYVVDLLEGIQTLFRSAPVTYIIAADRNWISTSFERAYAPFGTSVGDLGRPIGHLFLDKLFQISVAIPEISLKTAGRYWKALLELDSDEEPGVLDTKLKEAEVAAKEAVSDLNNQEDLDAKIDAVRANPIQEQAMRAAAALKITSGQARQETEHRLAKFSDILERNPRAMKRLVNAYGMHQASNILGGRRVDLDALARWTVLQLRWPILADALAGSPDLLNPDVSSPSLTSTHADYALITALLADNEVRRVISEGAEGSGTLTESLIRQIVGGREATRGKDS